MILKLFDRFVKLSSINPVHSIDSELKKLGFWRMILGSIICLRFTEIFLTYRILNDDTLLTLLALFMVILVSFFTIGLFTPLVTLILFLTVGLVDAYLHTLNLGTHILIITLIPFLVTNAGHFHSLDRILYSKGIMKGLTEKLYSLFHTTDKLQIQRAYFLSFLLYAIVSFAALAFHLNDEYWTKGLTLKSLMLNSFLNKYYYLARLLEENYPLILLWASISASVLQSIFQFLMIPLIFSSIGKKFIFYWGMWFFLISLIFINLSILPWIELILWIIIFTPARSRDKMNNQIRLIKIKSRNFFEKPFYISYFVVILIYMFFRFPILGNLLGPHPAARFILRSAGMDLPNVFNESDLRMGNTWAEIYRTEGEKNYELVPFSGTDGERLNYERFDFLNLSNHNSDLLYFHTTLAFRRSTIFDDPKKILLETEPENLRRRLKYDYNRMGLNGEIEYCVKIYQNSASEVTYNKTPKSHFDKKLISEFYCRFNGTEITIIDK